MSITLEDLDFLASPAGEHLLERLRREDLSEGRRLPLVTALRKEHSLDQVRAAVSLALLRLKARDKFDLDAERMFFTEDALQQASDRRVRRWRAELMASCISRTNQLLKSPAIRWLDVCCSIGSDTFAMARWASPHVDVLGLDIDPLRVKMAQLNAAALKLSRVRFEMADVRTEIPEGYDAIFYDPARRDTQGKRIHHVEQYTPPLSLVKNWQSQVIAVKLSPGVDLSEIAPYNGGVEFISVDGQLKEAVLWLGAGWRTKRAVLLTSASVSLWENPESPVEKQVSAPRGWLVEPDPSLIRACFVQDAAARYNGTLLDETIAYFTTDTKPDTEWVRAWEILDWMPFNLKTLKAYLRERNVGHVTVKKRGSPMTPEELIAKLKPKGDESRTLVLTRHSGQPIVMICKDITTPSAKDYGVSDDEFDD